MDHEYLLSYGNVGDFGRFRLVRPLTCRRGARAVVQSHRGLELGVVLCEATEGHARFLPNTTVGQLLRLATEQDEQAAEQMRQRGQRLFEAGRRLAAELALPLEVLDVEVLLDGRQAIVHHLRWAECDERPFVSTLAREHDLHVALHSLRLPAQETEHEEEGCGRPGCGRSAGGGCNTCGSGGGCSSCGSAAETDLKAYFTRLREQMLAAQHRTPLL
jgi:cell fate regulator YaaT (PSP1 superfamily)